MSILHFWMADLSKLLALDRVAYTKKCVFAGTCQETPVWNGMT